MLLKAVQSGGAEVAGLEPYRIALERALLQAVGAQARQDAARAASRQCTVEVNKAFAASREAANLLRLYIKVTLGFRTERLSRYGIKPFRKRRRPGSMGPASCGLPS